MGNKRPTEEDDELTILEQIEDEFAEFDEHLREETDWYEN